MISHPSLAIKVKSESLMHADVKDNTDNNPTSVQSS